jgi:glutaminyl-tRNA synthetase
LQCADLISRHKDAMTSQRYLFNANALLPEFKAEGDYKWVDGGKLKAELDAAVLALLGPKTAADEAREKEAFEAKKKEKKATAGGKDKKDAADDTKDAATAAAAPADGNLNGGAFEARQLEWAVNSAALLEEHRAATGGKTRTRFPPEPNGYLHIGHAKSMNLNFEGAFKAANVAPGQGETIFRYDDTNPEKENDVYIRSQADNVQWLGWRPVRVTHSSDYFPQLYDFARQLIKKGKAYVCHQSKEEMEASREIARAKDGRDPHSPWRNRGVEENLREFEAMRDGRYEEGKAVLRLRIDMTHSNPTLWDPVAYRIKYVPHPVTGNAWCIYPNYDFSHCIIDSLEHIDYSLCTLEFEVRRDLYYWTLNELGLYRPHVWEFSRLNITHTMLSKRNILKLVTEQKVRGWDDPRLATINGLRRRGYTPEAMNAFCRDIGVTRNENTILFSRLEHFVRDHLDQIARRAFAVLRPLRLVLENLPEDHLVWCEAADFPRDPALGMHQVPIQRVVYIEQEDFRLQDSGDYYGLAPGKVAGLRYAGFVKVTGHSTDAEGRVTEVRAQYDHGRCADFAEGKKVKGNLHWVCSPTPGQAPEPVEIRLYDHLFATEAPGSTGDWESEINPGSETVLKNCFVDASLLGLAAPGATPKSFPAPLDHFQFERLGYFVVDTDTDGPSRRLVFNQTVSLKEDTAAKKVRGGK